MESPKHLEPSGYGLTVCGEQPVFVESVKPDGAAARAGVREADQIIKINGMPVSSSNRYEVLRMISGCLSKYCIQYHHGGGVAAGPNVVLSLLGEPLSCHHCRPAFFEPSTAAPTPPTLRTRNSAGNVHSRHEPSDVEVSSKCTICSCWVLLSEST